jgi:hypothetical protein
VTAMQRKESERLLQGLQNFANLGDSITEFWGFSNQWPDFFPVKFRSVEEPSETLTWSQDSHGLVLAYRDMLRHVWGTGSERVLALLLGVDRDAHALINSRSQPRALDRMLGYPTVDLWTAMNQIPKQFVADLTEVSPHWQRGEFRYEPKNDFQKALYLLWRQSWRAKSCRTCHKYFVADKPGQMYCSIECSIAQKQARDRAWWREHGEKWRANRSQPKPKRNRESSRRSNR